MMMVTVRYAVGIPPSVPDSHPHRITSTKCPINTVVSDDDDDDGDDCDCPVCSWNSTQHTRQLSTQNNKHQVSHKHRCFYWWWAHSRPKHVEIERYTKNKLCNYAPSWFYLWQYNKVSAKMVAKYCGTDTYNLISIHTRQWRSQEFCSRGSTNSVEDRRQTERGSGGSSPLVRGSGGSCNLVQEISFHIVKFS